MTIDHEQRTAVVAPSRQTATLPARSESYVATCKKLATEDRVTERTQLIPADLCRAIVADIDGDQRPASPETSTDLAERLIDCYPGARAHDVYPYVLLASKEFAMFPEALGRRVVDPSGLPRQKPDFLPTIGAIRVALESEAHRRGLIRANALTHIQEAARRQRAAVQARDLEARRGTEADRAAAVAKHLHAKVF